MSSSAFGDFGPLTERRRAEKARQQRRRIMIAAGTISIIIILIAMGSAAVMYSGKKSSSDGGHKSASKGKSSGGSDSDSGAEAEAESESESESGSESKTNLKAVSKSIKAMCSQTDYTDACEKSLGKAANASSSSPKDIIRSAVEVIGDAIGQAFDRADLILSNDPLVKGAVADCKEVFADAKDDLNSTLKGVDDKDGIAKQSYQLRIWLSAVIANMETCVDGFPDDEFKAKVKESFNDGKELTSNALALIEKGSSLLSVLKGGSKRRLLEEEGEPAQAGPALDKDGIPEWVPDGERRVLKGGGFKSTLTPNVVVAKDGSGKFKTINEALAAMPKTYDGR
jgi:pectinesterase inhibitor-like protein